MKYRVRINHNKLEELKKKLHPGHTWWAFTGIIVFFFLPEIIAYYWGDEIIKYFALKEQNSADFIHKFLYKHLKSLGENSLFNIGLGFVFVFWFFSSKRDKA